MDKLFWVSLVKNSYVVPAGHTVASLTDELFALSASIDPELRDTIGLEVFFHWLDGGLFSSEQIGSFIPRLLANLRVGLGEVEGDSVFLRSFSALWLSLIVQNDQKKPSLTEEQIALILEAALVYLPEERDLRGLVPVKGWAHAIAHCADLFAALARSPHTHAKDHVRILNCMADKLKDSRNWVYLYGEDSRLCLAAVAVFMRGTLSIQEVKTWLVSLSADWNNSWSEEGRARAFLNGRNFLRALYWKMLDKEIPNKEAIQTLLRETLDPIQPIVYLE
jgi:hypothetical protein